MAFGSGGFWTGSSGGGSPPYLDVPVVLSVTGATPETVASVYLEDGTLQASSLAYCGVIGGADTGVLKLLDDGAATIATWTIGAGSPVQSRAVDGGAAISAGWHHFTLEAGGAGEEAVVQGIHLVW